MFVLGMFVGVACLFSIAYIVTKRKQREDEKQNGEVLNKAISEEDTMNEEKGGENND